MIKLLTLRNILILLCVIFFTSCNFKDSDKDDSVSFFSKKDKYADVEPIAVIRDENGRQIIVAVKKK